MFCNQCEQVAQGGCIKIGACGKKSDVAALQDLLVYALKGLSLYAVEGRTAGIVDRKVDEFAVSALFYQYLESTLGAPYTGWRNITAWIHLLLGGVGASAGCLLMAYGGYMGGAALLPVSSGGLGKNTFYVHTNILGPLSPYITGLLGLALLGFFIGGAGYVTAWWAVRRKKAAE